MGPGLQGPATSSRSLKGLWPFLRPYRRQMVLATVCLCLAALATLALPGALRQLIDQGLAQTGALANGTAGVAWTPFAWLWALAILWAVFSAARFYLMSWLGERVVADVRSAVYGHVLRQSPVFFESTPSGEVLSRLTGDTALVQSVVGSSLSMGVRNAILGIGALGMLLWTHPWLTLQMLGALCAVVLPGVWLGRRVRRLSRASQDRVADTSALASEILGAIPVVQSLCAESREAQRYQQSAQRAFTTATQRVQLRAGLMAYVMVSSSAALLWGLYLGVQAVNAGELTAGQLAQTVVYVVMLGGSLAVLGEVWGEIQRAAGASERLVELLALSSSVQEPEAPWSAPLSPAGCELRFDHVSFAYPSRPQSPALRHFDVDIQRGETVALVGASGAGKTTVFQLLQRFYDAQEGGIVIDGVPIQRWRLAELRARIAWVPQDPVIFSANALENIRYGRPGASDAEVEAAARAAFADGFIRELPQGYQTFLGERGVRLSGGQKQRIAIARAMLQNAPLLLLDEATSALDSHSEQMVQAALESAMRHRTTLVIAHRLSTVQRADRILVLDQGRLVEQGRHADLWAQGGVYARLAALQFQTSQRPDDHAFFA